LIILTTQIQKLKDPNVKVIKGDILHSQTSIALAKKELGFEPKISLRKGLSRFFQDYS
jgi:nucleoside-diphosphate-sugar epimerase